jgi:hypothetical protein
MGTPRAALSNEDDDHRVFFFTTRVALAATILQSPTSSGPAAQAGLRSGASDSARLVRGAHSAQSSFESFRRLRLPIQDRGSGPCDVRVGRYCYWRGDDDEQPPPEEDRRIGDRRDELIRVLDSAAHAAPADQWVTGQLVRYLVEAGRTDQARSFANRDCEASADWCAALAGYAAHAGKAFAAADSAFEHALSAMEPGERCRWLDVSDMLDDESAKRYDGMDCAARERFFRRAAWLGAPLYSISTTDLFTEHLSRVTRAHMAERSASPDGVSWGDDVDALMTRYGWPRWYSRSLPSTGSQLDASITGHDAGMPYDFFPRLRAIDHFAHVTDDDWKLDDAHAPTGYAPSYARSMHHLPSQIATFRRGDSVLVVAAWDARKDTTLLGRALDATLNVVADSMPTVRSSSHTTPGERGSLVAGTLAVAAAIDSGVVSLELLAADDRRAARRRLGIPARARGAIGLSDVLLYNGATDSASELDQVRESMLASTNLSSRVVGAYWEVYGLSAQSGPVQFSLSVEPFDIGWTRRLAQRVGLTDPATGLRLQWQDAPRTVNGILSRAVRVDLSRLRGGKYRLTLAATTRDGSATSSREIEVR